MGKKKEKDKTKLQRAFFYPPWDGDREARRLERLSKKGILFKNMPFKGVYEFSKGEAGKESWSVQYMGKTQGKPGDIETAAQSGWDYAGTFWKRRYFKSINENTKPLHEILDHAKEEEMLRLWLKRFKILMLLNLPGTLYCSIFIFMFLSDGFSISSILYFPSTSIYFWGTLVGFFAYFCLAFWHKTAKNRLLAIRKSKTGGS